MGFYQCLSLRQMTGQGLVLATAWTVWSRTSSHSDHFHLLPFMEKQWERKVFSNPWTNTPLFLESAHSALVQQVLQDSFWESPSCKPLVNCLSFLTHPSLPAAVGTQQLSECSQPERTGCPSQYYCSLSWESLMCHLISLSLTLSSVKWG